ncbi:MAG: hexitol phosphatase HxpB [Deinococcales bacterium]|nr:hexitol phosphatase HxpB [Chitinophagaceae bacterium]
MPLNTVIFDMDGLLIDSEPLWNEAAIEVFKTFGAPLTQELCNSTTGLRTREFVQWWFAYFNITSINTKTAENLIFDRILQKVEASAAIMPGVHHIINFFYSEGFKIGIATSSPQTLIDLVVRLTGIGPYINATSSAEDLAYGKPHPQVYLDCAEKLQSNPTDCLCFEDSFNGLIAAKAARMKCVVVPHGSVLKDDKWGAADLKLTSLQNFGVLHFDMLNR